MVAPPSGTQSVRVDTDEGGSRNVITCLSFAGVDQTAPLGPIGVDIDNRPLDTPSEVVIASATGDMVMDHFASTYRTSTISAGAGQTERSNLWDPGYVDANSPQHGTSTAPGAASVTMSWVGSNNNTRDYVHQAVNIVAASGGGGTVEPAVAMASYRRRRAA